MSFGISQFPTIAGASAPSFADGLAGPDARDPSGDPAAFAEACTSAADALAEGGLGPAGLSASSSSRFGLLGGAGPLAAFFTPAQAASPLTGGLLGVLSSLADAGGSAGARGGLAAALPGFAKTIAGVLA